MSNFTSQLLSEDEKRRFDRQFRLPGWDQELLKKSTVLLVGVGGLGVEVAKNLTMVGVGRLILVDFDTIEYSNLNRQILFVDAPEGSYKAEYAAKKLLKINPHVKIEAYNCALQDLPPRIFYEADLYIAGLDSIEARVEMNRRAVQFNKPLIDAGTAAYNGHVYVVFPFENACLECDPLTERDQDQLGACTLVGRPRRPAHCILKGQLSFEQRHHRSPDIHNVAEVKEVLEYANSLLRQYFPAHQDFTVDQIIQIVDNHEATVITINCVMASLQSQEAVKILHHIHTKNPEARLGTLQKNYLIYNGLTGKFYEIEKPKNPKCEMCGESRTPIYKIKVRQSYRLSTIIHRLSKDKHIPVDPDFPPTVLKIDSSNVSEIDIEQTILEADIRDFETVLVTGFDDGSQLYLTFKLED